MKKNQASDLLESGIINDHEYQLLSKKTIHQSNEFFEHINLADQEKLKKIANFFANKNQICRGNLNEHSVDQFKAKQFSIGEYLTIDSEQHHAIFISHPVDKKKLISHSGGNKPYQFIIVSHYQLMDIHSQVTHNRLNHLEKTDQPIDAPDIFKYTLNSSILKQASDIHIEKLEDHMRIRLRIDGSMHVFFKSSTLNYESLVSYIKIRSNCDITQQRLPQDGRDSFKNQWGYHKNLRISICPGMFGEKIVIRILKKEVEIKSFQSLGFNEKTIQFIKNKIQNNGLILVCGPTGSGKTTSLYTILKRLIKTGCNIMSAEDPVELPIEGVHQLSINEKIGLGFSQALRCFLRQDPDVIMVGEMRDNDTANIAIKAAQTGHLVLSTLHCNSAKDSFTRLKDLSVSDLQLKSVSLVISQRLLKKLCVHCKIPLKTIDASPKYIDKHLYMKNKNGCPQCINGLCGRIGVFEVWDSENDVIICDYDDSIKHLIENGTIDYSSSTIHSNRLLAS